MRIILKKLLLMILLCAVSAGYAEQKQEPKIYEPSGTGVVVAEFVYEHPVLLCALLGGLGRTAFTRAPIFVPIEQLCAFVTGGAFGLVVQSYLRDVAHRWLHVHAIKHAQLMGVHCH